MFPLVRSSYIGGHSVIPHLRSFGERVSTERNYGKGDIILQQKWNSNSRGEKRGTTKANYVIFINSFRFNVVFFSYGYPLLKHVLVF